MISEQRRHKAIGSPAGAKLSIALREGHGFEEFYDAAAAPVYQYCWTLIGPGNIAERGRLPEPRLTGSCAALWETLLAAVSQIDQLRDPADFPAWLFALARAACHRRGFAADTPYASLATVDAERPLVDALSELPPSHRELLELTLRHRLTPAERGRILGLDAEAASQLAQAAVKRTIDLMRTPGTVSTLQASDVADLLELVPPPLPPHELRELVLSGCMDAGMAAERAAAAQRMRPLGADGFPLHRDRYLRPSAAPDAECRDADKPPNEERAAAPADRVTTDDVAARRLPEQLTEIAPDAAGDELDDDEDARGRWTTPAIAGILTIAAAVGIWGASTIVAEGPVGNGVDAEDSAGAAFPQPEATPDEVADGPLTSEERLPEGDGMQQLPLAELEEPDAADVDAEADERSGSAQAADDKEEPEADDPSPDSELTPVEGRGEAPPSDEDPDEDEGLVSSLLGGLRDLLGG